MPEAPLRCRPTGIYLTVDCYKKHGAGGVKKIVLTHYNYWDCKSIYGIKEINEKEIWLGERPLIGMYSIGKN